MISLYKYILENVDLVVEGSGGFRNVCNTLEDLKNIGNLNINTKDKNRIPVYADEVIKLLKHVYDKCGVHESEFQIVYSESDGHFKVPYFLCDYLIYAIDVEGFGNKFTYGRKDEHSNKIYVYLIREKSSSNIKVFETGNGSVGRISTSEQENATCQTWNNFINQIKQVTADKSDINNNEYINTNLNNATEDIEISKDWKSSCIMQCRGVLSYLKHVNCDPKKYYMVRYGDSGDIKETAETKTAIKVISSYKRFVDTYTNALKKTTEFAYINKKDNFDPTDVIIFNYEKSDYIINSLNSYERLIKDDYIKARTKFLTDLFLQNLLIGISLKKISGSSHTFEKFNIGENVEIKSVSSYRAHIGESGKNISVICSGNFDFEKITMANVKNASDKRDEGFFQIPSKNNNKCKLVMRTFGDGTVGIDCFLYEGATDDNFNPKEPSLGKCPADLWRQLLGIERGTGIIDSISKFKKVLDRKGDNVNKILSKIINDAIKSGPHCFPFILIH